MSTKPTLDPQKLAALKTATQLLIREVGGLLAAASVCRVEIARLSEYQNPNAPGALMPIDIALQLEAYAPEPFVTGAMARLQGYTVARPDAPRGPSIDAAVATVSDSSGQATAAFVRARADGVLDAAEEAEMRRHFEAVRDAAEAALAGLGAGGDGVVLPLRAGVRAGSA